jgi:mRNA-degrading endonuclease toxin of MazEF toxin-antitoxin module
MIRCNDVVFVELPPPLGGVGHEQTGRRLAMAVQDELATLPTVLVVPLTSRLEALRFPFTLRIEPSEVVPRRGLNGGLVREGWYERSGGWQPV